MSGDDDGGDEGFPPHLSADEGWGWVGAGRMVLIHSIVEVNGIGETFVMVIKKGGIDMVIASFWVGDLL